MTSTLWRSPDRQILVMVLSGTVIAIPVKKTVLISRIDEEQYIATTDDFGEGDLSGVVTYLFVLNGDFRELIDCHIVRFEELPSERFSFAAENGLDDLAEIDALRAFRLEERGYAYFLDPARKVWRYTPKGALLLYFREHLRQLREGRAQADRIDLERPGGRPRD